MASQAPVLAERADIPDRRASLGQILREWPLLILLAVVTLFFARPLFLGQTFFFRDLTLFYFPQRVRLVELIRSSGVPLWNPFVHGGQPFLANVDSMAFYPTWLLYFVLPPVAAFNVEIVFHLLLSALAVYWLSRVLGLAPVPSFLSGVAFVFCGFTLSVPNLLNRLQATPNAVFLLLFWHLFLAEKKVRWFLGSVSAGVLIVFAGSVEVLLLTMAVALGWALAYPYSRDSLPPLRRSLAWCALAVGILGLAAVQIWPQLGIIRQSSRGSGLSFDQLSSWSLNPHRLPELFVPRFLGSAPSLLDNDYWGEHLEDSGHPLILSIYFGFPLLALAVIGGWTGGDGKLPSRFRRYLLFVAAIALLLSLGRFLFLSQMIWRVLPFGGLFRYPIKTLALAPLPLALLAAGAADRFSNGEWSKAAGPSRRAILVSWIAAVTLAGAAVAVIGGGELLVSLERFFFLKTLVPREQTMLAGHFFHAAFASAGLAVVLSFGARETRRQRWMVPALAVVILLDLAQSGRLVNPYGPRAMFAGEPAIVKVIRQNLGGGRLFRDEAPSVKSLSVRSDEVFWRYVLCREWLESWFASAFRIPVIFHEDYDLLAQRRLVRLTSSLRRLPWDQRLPLLSSGNVTAILTSDRPELPPLELVVEVPNRSDVRLFLYRNLAAAPRVGFVTNAVFVDSETNALRAILSRGFDPRNHVVLEGPGPASRGSRCAPASIVEMERTTTSWTGRVTTGCDGFLVFSEPFYDGWKGTVDGRSRPILHANLAFSAMALSAGTHVVSRIYRPAAVVLGAVVSAASVVLLILLALVFRSRSSRTARTREQEQFTDPSLPGSA